MKLNGQLSKFPNLSGIYKINNLNDGMCYIGSSVNIRKRLKDHRSSLIRGDHYCTVMQRYFNKYGIDIFEIEVLSTNGTISFPSEEYLNLLKLEEKYIAQYPNNYNVIKKPTDFINTPATSKVVFQYTMDGQFVKEWPSINEVKRVLGYSIQNAYRPNGISKSAHGFQWKFEKLENIGAFKSNTGIKQRKTCSLYDMKGNKLRTFESYMACYKFIFNTETFQSNDYQLMASSIKHKRVLNGYRFSGDNEDRICNNSRGKKGYSIIEQYDLEGNFIRFWKNAHTASIELGISSVQDNVAGKTKRAGQFIFRKMES